MGVWGFLKFKMFNHNEVYRDPNRVQWPKCLSRYEAHEGLNDCLVKFGEIIPKQYQTKN